MLNLTKQQELAIIHAKAILTIAQTNQQKENSLTKWVGDVSDTIQELDNLLCDSEVEEFESFPRLSTDDVFIQEVENYKCLTAGEFVKFLRIIK